MKIIVTTPDHYTLTLDVNPDDMIEDVKTQVETKHGYPVYQQCLWSSVETLCRIAAR